MGSKVVKKSPLDWTEKERAWAKAYARHGNGARAVREAGYDMDPMDVQGHSQMAAQIATRPHIKAWIEDLHERVAERYAITSENILAELAKIAFASAARLYKVNDQGQPELDLSDVPEHELDAIAGIQIKRKIDDDGAVIEDVKITMHPKTQALELLGKHRKLFTEVVDVSHSLAMADRITQARQRARLEHSNDEQAGDDRDQGEPGAGPDDGRAVRSRVQDGDVD